MSTKGPSNRYGNTYGSFGKGRPTSCIYYPWAKGFIKRTDIKHFEKHKYDDKSTSLNDYIAKALRFANKVDRKNNDSFVQKKTYTTYKYNKKTNEFVIVTKDGYIVSYYHPRNGVEYFDKLKKENKRNEK